LDAYVACKQLETSGLHVKFEPRPDGKVFSVSMKWTPPVKTAKAAVKTVSFIPDVVKQSGSLKNGVSLSENWTALMCQRISTDPLPVLIDRDAGTVRRDLPAIPDPPTATDKVLAALPPGTILPWFRSYVPSGWLLCDGQSGTPDLRDRFPYGTDKADSLGRT